MTVTEISCQNFRNLETCTLAPSEGVNIIYGENAQGKTNLLEGIWLFSGMKSFRGAKDAELIRFGCEYGRLKMAFTAHGRDQKAEITVAAKRRAKLNGVELPSCAGLIGKCRAVVFSPSFLSIVKNGPEERRRFIDAAVCQLKPAYANLLAEYNRLLKQRNSLLKDIPIEPALLDMLEVIDERLTAAGERLAQERKSYIEALLPSVGRIYDGFSGGSEEMTVVYVEKEAEKGSLAERLKANRKQDIINKTTSVGPHRDDLGVFSNSIDIRRFGSQGQQRSAALSLKLSEIEMIESVKGEKPILLLDDVLSELDTKRQDALLNKIGGIQTMITCTGLDEYVRKRFKIDKLFRVENGEIFYE